jgi:hypothetical protein
MLICKGNISFYLQTTNPYTRHCSLRSLVAKGTFSDVRNFLRYGAKNHARPLKVFLATSEQSELCRVCYDSLMYPCKTE